mmetsp:Transcript_11667/g.30405  ORF Transcript_11667/g.30405 Transcript_11667/m.30405 type:complete len:90 (+) Transcript_11667:99-368(+)
MDAALPPIDAPPQHSNTTQLARIRPESERKQLEAELDEAFEELGVGRGRALQEALKPSIDVPLPFRPATMPIRAEDAPAAVQTAEAAVK